MFKFRLQLVQNAFWHTFHVYKFVPGFTSLRSNRILFLFCLMFSFIHSLPISFDSANSIRELIELSAGFDSINRLVMKMFQYSNHKIVKSQCQIDILSSHALALSNRCLWFVLPRVRYAIWLLNVYSWYLSCSVFINCSRVLWLVYRFSVVGLSCTLTMACFIRKTCPCNVYPIILTCTHNLCFEQKWETYQNFHLKIFQFLKLKKSLYVAWTCFRNVKNLITSLFMFRYIHSGWWTVLSVCSQWNSNSIETMAWPIPFLINIITALKVD